LRVSNCCSKNEVSQLSAAWSHFSLHTHADKNP